MFGPFFKRGNGETRLDYRGRYGELDDFARTHLQPCC